MAYAQFDPILHDHYNIFATGSAAGTASHSVANINTLWGVGSGDKGYGQSTTLTAVAASAPFDTITATQWSTLIGRLNSILTHQAGSGSGITLPTAGATIAYIASLSGSITTATTNRLNFNSTRGTPSTTNYDGTWNSATPTSFQQVRTVTFASADQARYFFNAGGRIDISLSIPSGGADNNKESSWTTLLGTYFATINFDALTNTRTGTGGTLTTNGGAIGFWDLLTTDQTLIKLTNTTAAYTSNYVEVLCKVSGAAGSNGGLGTTLTFTINYNDGAADTTQDSGVPPVGQTFDAINMTVRAAVTITPPESTNITATWGAVTPAATVN